MVGTVFCRWDARKVDDGVAFVVLVAAVAAREITGCLIDVLASEFTPFKHNRRGADGVLLIESLGVGDG
jgi:hypothetical protein